MTAQVHFLGHVYRTFCRGKSANGFCAALGIGLLSLQRFAQKSDTTRFNRVWPGTKSMLLTL